MPANRPAFIDTNVVLYAIGDASPKQDAAWRVIFDRPCASVQVLNECSSVLLKKQRLSVDQVRDCLEDLMQFIEVLPLGLADVRRAWSVKSRYGFSYYDSLIVATALNAGCGVLHSEDLQHGQILDQQLSVTNPFLSPDAR